MNSNSGDCMCHASCMVVPLHAAKEGTDNHFKHCQRSEPWDFPQPSQTQSKKQFNKIVVIFQIRPGNFPYSSKNAAYARTMNTR
jgi:hypothetical protein